MFYHKNSWNSISEVFYYLDAEISFICGVDYGTYPFHSDICTLQMTSSSKNNESIIFKVGRDQSYIVEASIKATANIF